MLKKTLYTLLILFLSASVFGSCTDDFPVGQYEIGEGEALVACSVNFHPLVSTDVSTGSRTAGNALKDLDNITVFVYNSQSTLFAVYSGDELQDLKTTVKDAPGANTDMPDDAGEQAEETTATASFSLPGLPYGTYYMFVTANIDFGLSKQALMEKFTRLEDLKNFTVEWNSDNISANDQMFGYFTNEDTEDSGMYADNVSQVIINKKMVSLHAWVKRCASKVTVVFDGKGLKEDVWVYVQNVRIKSIPRYCKIGAENGVYTEKGGGLHGAGGHSLIVDGERIYYNTEGITTSNPGDDYTKWLRISKGSGLKGAVSVNEDTKETVTHSEYDQALYFYENLQGNYPGEKKYDKKQDFDEVGVVPGPGQEDYKDNVPYGTYIEVEAYYVSQNPENITNGRIIYRFMLGQDVDYNYNATRNHHYKVTLGFNGWANQPDWHIVYVEDEPTIFTNPTYYVSYSYNTQSFFPIRILGNPTGLEVEIVENNWAPYDPDTQDNVPPAEVASTVVGELPFRWNKIVYTGDEYAYGLKIPWDKDGNAQKAYKAEQIKSGAPAKVTGIWAGFLALQVPGNKPEDIGPTIMAGKSYSDWTSRQNFKKYFYNTLEADGPGFQQNYRSFSKEDLSFKESEKSKIIGSGNNTCEITKAADGSITVNLPMWTRPKSMLGISGFSGNNPYDTYQRRAIIRVTAKYEVNKQTKTITRYRPVYQVERVVNPTAVWRDYGDTKAFHVTLMRRNGAASNSFTPFVSEGAWRAHVKTVAPESSGFITLSGGNTTSTSPEYVSGATGTPIDFKINFSGGQPGKSLCAIVEVEYHGYTCKHSIYVRQGYKEPLAIVDGGASWSSFSLFKTKNPVEFGVKWEPEKKNYIPAELTANPLSLGTMFKRGNYNGILVWNNFRENFGSEQFPGKNKFKLSDSDISKLEDLNDGFFADWVHIQGYPYRKGYVGRPPEGGSSYKSSAYGNNAVQTTYQWGRFVVDVQTANGVEKRHYRVPDYNDYNDLTTKCHFGIGVMYGSGSTKTADLVKDAYGFLDVDNDGDDDHTGADNVGIRGIIVYNPKNANQVFFPIGFRGIGRRTITGYKPEECIKFGVLRYGSASVVLTQQNHSDNQFRPIPYNLPASPGAIYWISEPYKDFLSWDMNYFDLNFNALDYVTSVTGDFSKCDWLGTGADASTWGDTHGGDALPIKLVLDE